MQNVLLVALLTLALAFAGCTTDANDYDLPGDSPTGGADENDPTTSGPGDASGDESDETSMPRDGEDPPGFAPQTGRGEAIHGNLNLVGQFYVEGCESAYCLDLVVTNEGSEPVWYSSICQPPWLDRLTNHDGTIQHRENMAYCMAYGVTTLDGGESLQTTFMWDGMIHSDGEDPRHAPEDSYQWIGIFQFQESEEGAYIDLEVALPLIVGET